MLERVEAHRRLLALLDQFSENRIRPILQHKGVEALLNLDPPLESVFSAQSYERLDVARTARELSAVREPEIELKIRRHFLLAG